MRKEARLALGITVSTIVLGACVAGPGTSANAQKPRQISASERAQAAQAHPEIMAEFGGAYEGPGSAMVKRIGKEVAVRSNIASAQSECTVTLLNTTVVNAFAIPGCYVYMTRGLLSIMNSEAELASVLGHEIGHVDAQHSKKRQNAALGSGLVSILATVLTGSSQVGQLAGQLGQAWTMKYSRDQEYQSDDLGIRYMTAAGYDPFAAAEILQSLGDQEALETKIRGQTEAAQVPSWARSHPLTTARVKRASQKAAATGVKPGQLKRDAPDYYAAVDGMLYGDDPEQGFVEGHTFAHPVLKIAFEVPQGYYLNNGAAAVTASGAQAQIQFSGGKLGDGDSLDSYISTVFQGVLGNSKAQYTGVQRTTINGLDAATATARVTTQSGNRDVTVYAYRTGGGSGYHFVFISPSNVNASSVVSTTARSFRRLTDAQAAALRKRVVQVVTVRAGDTAQSISQRMAFSNYRLERFLVMNNREENPTLRAGEKVKIVVYG
ncbi:M48 family metalloprotease [Sphingosinicella soli]|uniref:Putative Zn-dependent protease n=1 Tax=Sphingosinicella soli TaxID=333708 RepID=A0A7W7F614_9SPHN|nr:M48 family metalloprotease [Sphingosinicella soli]MBB4632045.1 putative Zn-dependent protease [Sphingosinicella soli]